MVFLHQHRFGVDQKFAAITIDNQQSLAEQRRLNIRAHHRRYAHRPHQYGCMGVGGTVAHHHADQPVLRHFSQQSRGQLIGYQHKTRRPLGSALGGVIEME
ncbi:hypothetical protein D3C78_666440 [compost metagenome]